MGNKKFPVKLSNYLSTKMHKTHNWTGHFSLHCEHRTQNLGKKHQRPRPPEFLSQGLKIQEEGPGVFGLFQKGVLLAAFFEEVK